MNWQRLLDVDLDPDALYLVKHTLHGGMWIHAIMRGRDLQHWKDRGQDVDIVRID